MFWWSWENWDYHWCFKTFFKRAVTILGSQKKKWFISVLNVLLINWKQIRKWQPSNQPWVKQDPIRSFSVLHFLFFRTDTEIFGLPIKGSSIYHLRKNFQKTDISYPWYVHASVYVYAHVRTRLPSDTKSWSVFWKTFHT